MLRAVILFVVLMNGANAQEAAEFQKRISAVLDDADKIQASSEFKTRLKRQRHNLESPNMHDKDLSDTREDFDHQDKAVQAMQETHTVLQSEAFQSDLQKSKEALKRSPKAGQMFDVSHMPKPKASPDQQQANQHSFEAAPPPTTPFTDGPLVFVSFSMPEPLIVDYLKQAKRWNAQVVLRGAINGDIPTTFARVQALIEKHDVQGVMIDPTLFQRFGIQRVPAMVLPLEPLKPCEAQGCGTPKHIKAFGDVSIDSFLQTVTRLGDRGEQQKATALLEKASL